VYLFDTDTTSNFLDDRRQNPHLRQKVLGQPAENLCISIVTVDELLRGMLALVADARSKTPLPQRYALLHKLFAALAKFNVAPYDDAAHAVFERIPVRVRQRHPKDCRIAAIALSRGMVIVTSNQSDFQQISGAQLVDWMLGDR
jgi:tRNA(fMet)-specific endonuclease VapC